MSRNLRSRFIEDQTAALVVAKNASRNDGAQITEQNLIKSV
jgi:hypothetical protein